MASLTIAIDPEILEAAKLEAARRQTSLDQLVADYLTTVASPESKKSNRDALLRLIQQSPLGDIDRPLTREEIYAERSWPRS